MKELNEELLLAHLHDYIKKRNEFADNGKNWTLGSIKEPLFFWQLYEDNMSYLSVLGQLVCAYVPHTCSSERNWSSHVQFHTKTKLTQFTVYIGDCQSEEFKQPPKEEE